MNDKFEMKPFTLNVIFPLSDKEFLLSIKLDSKILFYLSILTFSIFYHFGSLNMIFLLNYKLIVLSSLGVSWLILLSSFKTGHILGHTLSRKALTKATLYLLVITFFLFYYLFMYGKMNLILAATYYCCSEFSCTQWPECQVDTICDPYLTCTISGIYCTDPTPDFCCGGTTCDGKYSSSNVCNMTYQHIGTCGADCTYTANGDGLCDSSGLLWCIANTNCNNNNPDRCANGAPPVGYCSGCIAFSLPSADAAACHCKACGTDNGAAPGSCDNNTVQGEVQDPWNGGSTWNGDVSTTCCGDDANEFPTNRSCVQGVCTNSSTDLACCTPATDCNYGGTCYATGSKVDANGDYMVENCTNGVWVQTLGGNLIVNLTYPDPGVYTTSNPLSVRQNTVFNVNATVTCGNYNCSNVSGTVRYNASSTNPDTEVSSTVGGTPLYNTSGAVLQSCNFLKKDDSCQLNWTINATGSPDSAYKVGVLFNSSSSSVTQNNTNNMSTRIIGGNLEVSLTYPPVGTTWVNQNSTFNVNSTITCKNANCGNVSGTVRYNASSTNPDSGINKTEGTTPFFIEESWKGNSKSGISTTSYSNSDNKAYTKNDTSTDSFSQATTEVTDYTRINVSDYTSEASYTDASVYQSEIYTFQKFTFNLSSIDVNDIINLTYCHEGYYQTSGSPQVGYYDKDINYYNVSNIYWTFDQSLSTADVVKCKNFNSGFNDLINSTSKLFQFGLRGRMNCNNEPTCSPVWRIDLYTNDVYLIVTTRNALVDCGNMNQGDSYQLNWTVNATGTIESAYKVGVLFNSSYSTVTQNHTNNATIRIPGGNLTVSLVYPPSATIKDQNTTFNVNATVTCINYNCGNVYGTVRYNASSANPDTEVNMTTGATPFYIVGPYQMLPTYAKNNTADVTNKVNTSDNVYGIEYCSDNECLTPYIYINFTTSSTYENVTVEGYADGSQNFECWSGSTWVSTGITFSMDETNRTGSLASCSNSNGNYTFRARGYAVDPFIEASIVLDYVFLNSSVGASLKSCGSLSKDQSCQLNWTVNATGTPISYYNIGVLFNSSYTTVTQNHTDNVTITIIECTESMNIGWNSIDFGNLNPNTPGGNNPALSQSNKIYNISNTGTCNLKIWIKGTDIENTTLPSPHTIGVGNLTWSNTTESYINSYAMTTSYVLLNSSFTPTIKNITTYYWLTIPPGIYAGRYNGTVYICENTTQKSGVGYGSPC